MSRPKELPTLLKSLSMPKDLMAEITPNFPLGTHLRVTGVNFLYKHYGVTYALPAFAIAASVSHSRIKGKYHTFMDVLAGALLAVTVDELFTRNMDLKPIRVGGFMGFN